MPTNKKDKTKPKKEKPVQDESDDDDDDEPEEEEEEVEPEHVKRKRERGRSALLTLVRRLLALIPLGLVLSRQPFMVKARGSGTNAMKLKPVDVAIAGAAHFAVDSPTFIRKPHLHQYLNQTGRALLTPGEWVTARQSKRAMPAEQTISGAYKKTEKAFSRVVDKDSQLKELVTAPQPNFVLLGSAILVLGCLLCPFVGGVFEYLIVIGCVGIMQGGRQLGMEAQPELYVTGGAAVLCIMAMEGISSGGKKAPTRTVKKRR